MITKEIALSLRLNQTLYSNMFTNADGTPKRCRVNGRCKTWKTRPTEFRLPVKYGFHTHFYITNLNAGEWETDVNVAKEAIVSEWGKSHG